MLKESNAIPTTETTVEWALLLCGDGFGRNRGGSFLRWNQRQLLDNLDSGPPQQLENDRPAQPGRVVLHANGLPLLAQLDTANPVHLPQIAERGHGRLGQVMLIAIEDFELRHALMIQRGVGETPYRW